MLRFVNFIISLCNLLLPSIQKCRRYIEVQSLLASLFLSTCCTFLPYSLHLSACNHPLKSINPSKSQFSLLCVLLFILFVHISRPSTIQFTLHYYSSYYCQVVVQFQSYYSLIFMFFYSYSLWKLCDFQLYYLF